MDDCRGGLCSRRRKTSLGLREVRVQQQQGGEALGQTGVPQGLGTQVVATLLRRVSLLRSCLVLRLQDAAEFAVGVVYHPATIVKHHGLAAGWIAGSPGQPGNREGGCVNGGWKIMIRLADRVLATNGATWDCVPLVICHAVYPKKCMFPGWWMSLCPSRRPYSGRLLRPWTPRPSGCGSTPA